jgi:hypothetical protein
VQAGNQEEDGGAASPELVPEVAGMAEKPNGGHGSKRRRCWNETRRGRAAASRTSLRRWSMEAARGEHAHDGVRGGGVTS